MNLAREISEKKSSNLILTFDYELFGNGTGNVFTHIIEPTNQILEICDEFGIKVTIFFEVIEYVKLKEQWNNGNKMGYTKNPVEAIETQIQNAVKNGHDVQLHVHPQWVNAKYSNNKWDLDLGNWRLGDFSTVGYSIKELLRDSKNELEKLITPAMPDYKCTALRAGAYNIMPSREVYTAMKELGLRVDSSVYPGGFENSSLQKFDYSNVPIDLDYWWADENDIRIISKKDKEVLEIPIFALPVPVWKRVFTYSKIKSLLFSSTTAISPGAKEKLGSKSLIEKIKFILKKEVYTWDVCMFSRSLNKRFFKHIEENLLNSRRSFVLIGHPKNLEDYKLFSAFLKIAHKRKRSYTFKSLSELYAELI